jgi:hypothetical protein
LIGTAGCDRLNAAREPISVEYGMPMLAAAEVEKREQFKRRIWRLTP